MKIGDTDPTSSCGNIVIGGAEIFADLEMGKRAAQEAMIIDRGLFRGWLDENFPYTYGPHRNEPGYVAFPTDADSTLLGLISRDTGPLAAAWQYESVAKALETLNNGKQVKIQELLANFGPDWLDETNCDFKYFGVIQEAPQVLQDSHIARLISEHSRNIMGEATMPSFAGTIVCLPEVVCQFTLTSNTAGFPIENRHNMPAALIVRAWRTY